MRMVCVGVMKKFYGMFVVVIGGDGCDEFMFLF